MNKEEPVSFKAHLSAILRAYLILVITCIILTIVCFLLFFIEEAGITLKQDLQLSRPNIWGVFTVMFVHNSSDHLYANITMLWVTFGFAVVLFSLHSKNEIRLPSMIDNRQRALFFVIAIVLSAVTAHSIWYVLVYVMIPENNIPSAGLSGLTNAFMGAIIASSAFIGWDAFSKRRTATDRKIARFVLLATVLAAGLFAFISLVIPFFAREGHHFLASILGILSIAVIESFLRRPKDVVVSERE